MDSQHLVDTTHCNAETDEVPSCPRLRLVGETDT